MFGSPTSVADPGGSRFSLVALRLRLSAGLPLSQVPGGVARGRGKLVAHLPLSCERVCAPVYR